MSDLDKLKDKYDKKESKSSETIKSAKSLTKELESKKDSAPVRAAKQAISGFRSQWSGIDEKGNVGVGKGTPGIYYNTVAIPALAGVVDDKYAPDFAVEADKKAGKIREAVRKDMGIEAPKGALEHFANAGGEMLAQLPIPGAWLNRVLTPVKSAGIAGKVATSPIEYLSPIVDPKKINYGVGTGFGGTIGTVGEMLEEEPTKKALGGLIQKYEGGGKVGNVKSFFSAIDKAIDTLKQKKGTGEQILKEIEKAPGVKKEELELRKIAEKLKDKKSITQEEVKKLASETPAPGIKTVIRDRKPTPVSPDWQPQLSNLNKGYLEEFGVQPLVNPDDTRMLGFLIEETGDIVDINTLKSMTADDFGLPANKARRVEVMQGVAEMVDKQFRDASSAGMSAREPKFEKYTTPGGQNYREILLQVDRPSSSRSLLGGDPEELTPAAAAERIGMDPTDFAPDSTVLYYPTGFYIERSPNGYFSTVVENRDISNRNLEEVEDFLASAMAPELDRNMVNRLNTLTPTYRGGHFDESNVVVHARVTDRTGPNGEKVLYVEEIQSDWHQAARKKRDQIIDDKLENEKEALEKQSREIMESIGRSEMTRENAAMREGIFNKLARERRAQIAKEVPKDEGYSKSLSELEGLSADDVLWEYGGRLDESQKSWLRDFIERWEMDVDGSPAGQAAQQQLSDEYETWLRSNSFKGIPDVPWKNTSNELAVKQILDIAAKEGYDTVAFSPGSEHVKRYGMGEVFDALTATKEPNGQIRLVGTKEGKTVVDRKVDAEDLPDYIGKEKAENIMEQLRKPTPVNEASEKLRGKVAQWSEQYGDDFPVTLKQKLTPEEQAEWDTLLSESRAWDKQYRPQGEKIQKQAILVGDDLELTTAEGAGKKKIYDEIIPNFVRKYAKKEFGAEPVEIEISLGGQGKTYKQYLDEIYEDPARYMDEDEYFDVVHQRVGERAIQRGYDLDDEQVIDDIMNRNTSAGDDLWAEVEQEFYEEKAKELAAKDKGGSLKAFAVPVTPQMREKITSQGQPLFSVAAPVAVGAPQVIPQAEPSSEPEAAPEPEEMPVPYQSGGRAQKEDEYRGLIEEEPMVRIVRDAAKQYVQGKDIESGVFGVSKGPVTVGRQMVNMRDPGSNEYMNAQADFARLAEKYGRGNIMANVMKPDQTRGVYMGDVQASYPVGEGRVMAGVRGMKTPEKTGVTGYNVGYSGKAGPGYIDAQVMLPKDRRQDTRYQVGYTLPFSSGGPVGFESGGKVGKTREAAERLLRVLHGSPSNIVPEAGRSIDVTTESGYAVKRGADKMLGKEGPPMVNRFDIPEGRLLRFEEQYSPEDVALMRRYFNKLPQGQAMKGDEIWDAAQGRDVIMEGLAKAGGFAGYERPNTGAVGKGQWFRVTEPEELKKAKKRGGLV
jgi:uncharacterized protein YidB (DUF937 family)